MRKIMNNISIKMGTNNTNKNQNKKEMKKLEHLQYKNNSQGCNDDVNQNKCYVNFFKLYIKKFILNKELYKIKQETH